MYHLSVVLNRGCFNRSNRQYLHFVLIMMLKPTQLYLQLIPWTESKSNTKWCSWFNPLMPTDAVLVQL